MNFFKAISIEIKNAIFKSVFHIIRFCGLLIIPFIYGFSYIFAFFDPFSRIDQVDAAFVVQKNGNPLNDAFAKAIGEEMDKEQEVELGDLKMTMNLKSIYVEKNDIKDFNKEVDKNIDSNFFVLSLPNTEKFIEPLIKLLDVDNSALSQTEILANITNAALKLQEEFGNLEDKDKIRLILNDKKNYLVSYGVKLSTSMTSTFSKMIQILFYALSSDSFVQNPIIKNKVSFKSNIDGLREKISNKSPTGESLSIIEQKSQMGGEHAKYGYGLAPFFISVAMWVGGMVLSFAIHKKVYDHSITPGVNYFAKWFLMATASIVQASILMLSLYFIGFNKLGIGNWSSMYMTAIFTGLIFCTIIQAIRFLIPDRNMSILIVIILLVLQMTSAGGLFPIKTQNSFWSSIHYIFPMRESVIMIREASFDTNWSLWFENFGIMLAWLSIVPFAIYMNYRRTLKCYINNKKILPPKLEKSFNKMIKKQKAGDNV